MAIILDKSGNNVAFQVFMSACGVASGTATASMTTSPVISVQQSRHDRGVYIPPSFTRTILAMGGTPTVAIVLSQILYWFLASEKSGKSKLRKMGAAGQYVLAKTFQELADETGLTARMVRTSIEWAHGAGIIARDASGFAGRKTNEIRFACLPDDQNIIDDPLAIFSACTVNVTWKSDAICPASHIQYDSQVISNTESNGTDGLAPA